MRRELCSRGQFGDLTAAEQVAGGRLAPAAERGEAFGEARAVPGPWLLPGGDEPVMIQVGGDRVDVSRSGRGGTGLVVLPRFAVDAGCYPVG